MGEQGIVQFMKAGFKIFFSQSLSSHIRRVSRQTVDDGSCAIAVRRLALVPMQVKCIDALANFYKANQRSPFVSKVPLPF